jgi:UrcA family protein
MKASKLVRRSSFATVALGATLFAGAALASGTAGGGDQTARSIAVRYADVNLATVAGATTLYQRIQGAARLVCGGEDRSLAAQHAWEQCYQNAVAEAVTRVNSPTLTAVHLSREAPTTAMLGN